METDFASVEPFDGSRDVTSPSFNVIVCKTALAATVHNRLWRDSVVTSFIFRVLCLPGRGLRPKMGDMNQDSRAVSTKQTVFLKTALASLTVYQTSSKGKN